MSFKRGRTSLNARLEPEHTKLSLPAPATLALPLTGAAIICTPCAAKLTRSSREASSEIEEHSTTMRNAREERCVDGLKPSGPCNTSVKTSDVDSMQKTISQPASSASV